MFKLYEIKDKIFKLLRREWRKYFNYRGIRIRIILYCILEIM